MANLKQETLLLEIGTEELPPQEVARLSKSLDKELVAALKEMGFAYGERKIYGTPRRLAVQIREVPTKQDDREVERKGPTVDKAFDADGKPTAAGSGFAKSCGVAIEKVEQVDGRLVHRQKEKGRKLGECLNEVLPSVVKKLPVSRRMRWGSEDYEFIRPVRWLCVVHGETTVKGVSLFGCESAPSSYGHRYNHPDKVKIPSADSYEETLQSVKVMPSFEERQSKMIDLMKKEFVKGPFIPSWEAAMALKEFVYSVEWPIVLKVKILQQFATIPSHIVQHALLKDIGAGLVDLLSFDREQGKNCPYCFVFIDGEREPEVEHIITQGYERVVLARLSDIQFFYQRDQKRTLESRIPELKEVIFEQHLGTLHDKTGRIKKIAEYITDTYMNDIDKDVVLRAADLCKCELVTELIKERPELESHVGPHYAMLNEEPDGIIKAIAGYWLPRRPRGDLPGTNEGIVLALADRLDTLVGILSTGESPTGSRDPFGLRRIALAIIRILIDKQVDLNLRMVLDRVYEGLPEKARKANGSKLALGYIYERLPAFYRPEQDQNDDDKDIQEALKELLDVVKRSTQPPEESEFQGASPRIVRAVLSVSPPTLFDLDRRVKATSYFMGLAEAESLIAANKRIANILRKQGLDGLEADQFERKARGDFHKEFPNVVEANQSASAPAAMRELEQCLSDSKKEIEAHVAKKDYVPVMKALAQFATPLEKFFDEVIVLSEREQERLDRLVLLREVRELFLSVADFSELGGELSSEAGK